MKENSFLKKFKGRMEQIGKNGYREILNNVHINIVDYIKNSQKVKKTKKKVDKYGQMKSEINKEITRNLNNNSRTKNTTLSPKKNKSEEFVRFNDNNNIKNIQFNKNKFNIKSKRENNKNKTKEKERPVKLLKNIIINNNTKGKENNKYNQKQNIKDNENKNNKNVNININLKNNNKINKSRDLQNSIKLKSNLPKIPQIMNSPKKNININSNIIIKNSNILLNKSQKRAITYTPKLKDINISNTQIINDKFKKANNIRLNSEKKDLKNYAINKQYNLPKIDKQPKKILEIENDKNIKLFNKQKNKILNSIKDDFLMLNSLKNKSVNIGKNKFMEEDKFYKNKNNINNQENKSNSNNFMYSHDNYINNNKNTINKKLNYYTNSTDSKDSKVRNDTNIQNSRNYYPNLYNIIENNNYKEDITSGMSEEKKPHTSFDNPKIIPKLNNKLDIIHEENEDDNKYITDVKFNNSFENKENLNSLEILMKQRAYFQNKMPNNSRFKLK